MTTKIINTIGAGQDYSDLNSWHADLGTVDLSQSNTNVYSHSGFNGALGPGANVTQQNSGATGTIVVHNNTLVLLRDVVGTFNATDVVEENGTPANNYTPTATVLGDDAIAASHRNTAGMLSISTFSQAGPLGSATNYLVIGCDPAFRHTGKPNTGAGYTGNEAAWLFVYANWWLVEYLELENTGTGRVIEQNVRSHIDACIVRGAGAEGVRMVGNAPNIVTNCLIIDNGADGLGNNFNVTLSYISNTCVRNGDNGANSAGASGRANNTVCAENTNAEWNGSYSAATSHNASSDLFAPGTSPQTSVSLTAGVDFVDPANDDYQPASGGKLDGNGTNLFGSDPFQNETDHDILGNARHASDPWAIGAWAEPPAATGDIAITTEPVDFDIIPRNSNGNNALLLQFAGTHTGATSVEYRLVDIDSGTAIAGHDWQVGDAAPTATNWSFDLATNTVQAAGAVAGIRVEVRQGNEVSVTAVGATAWGVGLLFHVLGSSNSQRFCDDSDGSYTSTRFVSQYNGTGSTPQDQWKDVVGDGAAKLGDLLSVQYNAPVGFLVSGVGGVAINQRQVFDGGDYWLDTGASSPYDNYLTDALTVGGFGRLAEAVIWLGLEVDANNGPPTETEIKNSLDALYTQLDTDIGTAHTFINLQMLFVSPVRDSEGTYNSEYGYPAIREGIQLVADGNANVRIAGPTYDLPQEDGLHLEEVGFVTLADRLAEAAKDMYGTGADWPPPKFASFAAVTTTTTDVTLTDLTDLTVTAGGNLWQVFDGNDWVQCTGSVKQTTTSVRLTHPVGTITDVRYMHGASPDIAGGLVKDTTTTANPLLPYPGLATTQLPISGGVDVNGGVIQARRRAPLADLPNGRKIVCSFWIKIDTLPGSFQWLLYGHTQSQGNDGNLQLAILASNKLRLVGKGVNSATTVFRIDTLNALAAGQWTHVVFSWDGDLARAQVYVDGVDATDNTLSSAVDAQFEHLNYRFFNFGATTLDCHLHSFLMHPLAPDLNAAGEIDKWYDGPTTSLTHYGLDGSTPLGLQPAIFISGFNDEWIPGRSLRGPNRGTGGAFEYETGGPLSDSTFPDPSGATEWDLQVLNHDTFDWAFIGNTAWELQQLDHETFDWAFIGNTGWDLQGLDHETFDWDHTQAGATTWTLQTLNHETFDWDHVAPAVTTWDVQTLNHETFDWQHVTPGTTTWDLQTLNHDTFDWAFLGHLDWDLQGFDHETFDWQHVVPAITTWDLQTLNHTTFDWVPGTLIRSELCVQIRVIPAIISCTSEMRGFDTVCSDKVHALKADSSNLIQWEARRGDTGAAITDGSGTFQLFDATDTEVLPGSIIVINAGAGLYQAVIDTSTLIKGRRYRGRAPLTFPSVAQTRTYKFWFEITDDADNECILQECA